MFPVRNRTMKRRSAVKCGLGFAVCNILLFFLACGGGGTSSPGTTPPDTIPLDTIPPAVLSSNPANWATSVAVNSIIAVTFSEAVTPSTITNATFTVSTGGNNVAGAVTNTDTTATFTPSINLGYGTTYTVTVTTGVKDLAGNALQANYTASFMTCGAPDQGAYLQGWAPGSLAITQDGKSAYVSFMLDDSLLVVNLATLTISDSIDVSAAGIQLHSDSALLAMNGKKLYVSNPAARNVMVVDTINNQVTKVLPIPPYYSMALAASPDGSKVYIPSVNGGLYIVNVADDSYQRIYIPSVLFGAIAPSLKNPNLLYSVGTLITNQGVFQSSFLAINVANQTVERSMSLPSEVIQYPISPRRLALNSNETVAYFGWGYGSGNLVTFDLSNFQVLTSAPAAYGVSDFAVNEPLGKIYVIGFEAVSANNVPILEWDISTNKFVRNIPLSSSSDQREIAVDPTNPDFLYEIDADHNILRKIQISTGQEVGRVQFNKDTIRPYAIIRGGNTGYIFCLSQDIYKLDLGSGQLIGRIRVPVPFAGWGFYQGKLYVSSGSDILAVNPSDGSIIQRYPIGWRINSIIFTFFGARMVAMDTENNLAKQLVVFDAQTMALLKTIPLPNMKHGDKIIASPDGSKLYITRGLMDRATTVITVFNAATLEVINTIEIPPSNQRRGATGFVEGEFDEANRILYLIGFASVYKIHMDTDTLIGTLDLIDIFDTWGRRGWTPTGLAGISFSPSKDKLFIVGGDPHSLYTYNIANSSWSTKITNLKGYFITDGVASQDRHYFYTANEQSDSVTMVDLVSGDIVRIIDLKGY
ncbi:hypothetical protein D4S03_08690 [bacterium]|nr:MAG: hypothetical protein D4S03_08690 [bacterium]